MPDPHNPAHPADKPHDPDGRREDLPEPQWLGHEDHGTGYHLEGGALVRPEDRTHINASTYHCMGGGPSCVRTLLRMRHEDENQTVIGGPLGSVMGGGPPNGWETPVHNAYPEMGVAEHMAKAPLDNALLPALKDLPRRASITADERLKQLETETGVPIRDRWNSNYQAAKKVFDDQFPPDMRLPDNANADVPAWQGMDGQGVSRSVPMQRHTP